MSNIQFTIIDQLRNATKQGCSFMSFLYRSKGTGETSRYTLNFGIDYRNAIQHDKELLESFVPEDELQETAKAEMLKSMIETIEEGVSRSYTQADTFEHIGKGIKQHKETGELYLYGFVENKEQVAPPTIEKKPVKSRPLTLAKKEIEKSLGFKRVKFAQFILNPENIAGIKVRGNLIEVH